MELRHLRYFVAVAEELNFTRAAERLYTSQPSLSEQIRNLEEEIGYPLLNRTRRKVELTEAGVIFLDDAREILHKVEEAVQRAGKAASQAREVLTIGFVPAAEVRIFPAVLPAFRAAFPQVDVVRSLTSNEQEGALARGELDLGFMRGPVRVTNVFSEVVLDEPLRVYLPQGHSLEAYSLIPPARLNRLPMIAVDRSYGRSMHDVLARYLAHHKVVPEHTYNSANPLMSINLVAAGLGYTLLPTYAEYFMPKNVVSRPLIGGGPRCELLMAYPRDTGCMSEAAVSLIERIRELARWHGSGPSAASHLKLAPSKIACM
ncbi:LysR substrate-binding domain-containing protein [Alcaligenes faecalis]|uniref:LysR substrate-binding domain-containing protein n=1 Tax=Alcaligenes faecalis TaxID=511 RepID=UPI00208EAC22|nr:LysR substrate-binding domain-containing protein [Alcaligenes faecalis]USP47086.1 LysR family transcriptional regulator [Alcaligenes faecalis]